MLYIFFKNLIFIYFRNDGAIKMIAQYDENNLYMVTPDIRRLFIDKQLQSDCLSNVSLPGR